MVNITLGFVFVYRSSLRSYPNDVNLSTILFRFPDDANQFSALGASSPLLLDDLDTSAVVDRPSLGGPSTPISASLSFGLRCICIPAPQRTAPLSVAVTDFSAPISATA